MAAFAARYASAFLDVATAAKLDTAAIEAQLMLKIKSARPNAWLGSTIMGKNVSFLMAGTAPRSRV